MNAKSHVEAVAKYDKTHSKGLYLKFNTKTDKDILNFLEKQENKQGKIKDLIRLYINTDSEN